MDNDALFKLYELYCESIAENVREESRKLYLPQIEKLTDSINTLTSENITLISELDKAKQLLAQHNIAY